MENKIFTQKLEKPKTREELLEIFQGSLKKYGVEGAESRIEGGRVVIEQKLGEGIRGLGYDKRAESLWMCLDQMDPGKSIKENQRWNANTILSLKSKFPGVVMEKIGNKIRVVIAADHPAAVLSKLAGKKDCVNLPGRFNDWKLDNPFTVNKQTGDLEAEIDWNGEETECKIAITETLCDWQDGEWKGNAAQKLNIS